MAAAGRPIAWVMMSARTPSGSSVSNRRVQVGIDLALVGLAKQGHQLLPPPFGALVGFDLVDDVDLRRAVQLAVGDLAVQPDSLAAQQQKVEPTIGQPLVLEDPAEAPDGLQLGLVGLPQSASGRTWTIAIRRSVASASSVIWR